MLLLEEAWFYFIVPNLPKLTIQLGSTAAPGAKKSLTGEGRVVPLESSNRMMIEQVDTNADFACILS